MTSSPLPGRDCDVLVAGGGPAGATAAALLARAGFSVLLCDAATFPRHKICGEYVPPSASRSFARLGVLAEVERLEPRRHVGMAVVAPDGTEVLGRYVEFDDDAAPTGFSLRRLDLDSLLLENARRCGVTVREGTRVIGLSRAGDRGFAVAIRAASGAAETVRARAIVGADGRSSIVARRLGLRRRDPHRRWAIMGHFRGVCTPREHGEMIVTPYGYCGINPLPAGLANVCIVVDPRRRGAELPGRPGLVAYFKSAIEAQSLTRRRMARAELADGLWATGPMACRSARPVADGVLLVGDAAGFFDPFTGEGIGMALRGGEMAAEVLGEALRRNDLSAAGLARYETLRRAAFAARLRLDRILQALLARPRLASWVARRLRHDQRLADQLARVAGDLAEASDVLRPKFVTRLLLA